MNYKIINNPSELEDYISISEYNMLKTLYDNKLLYEIMVAKDVNGYEHICATALNQKIVFFKLIRDGGILSENKIKK